MKKRALLPIIAATLVIVGCGKSGTSSLSSSMDTTSSSRERHHSSIDLGPSVSTLSTDPVEEGGSMSGSLIEISTGTYLEPGYDYLCSFVPTSYANTDIKVVSTDENVATIRFVEGSKNKFYVEAKAIGDTILKIYAAEDDFLCYRKVVSVRKAFNEKEIGTIMYETYDLWQSTGIYGQYTMSFVTDDPLNGTLTGRDDYEYTYLNFLVEYKETKMIYDFRFHCFEIKVDLDNSNTERVFTEMDVAVTGDNILVYYDEGLFEMFKPKNK